jgi:hypothetical protein
MRAYRPFAVSVLVLCAGIVTSPILAQPLSPGSPPREKERRVELIISGLPPPTSKGRDGKPRTSQARERIRNAINSSAAGDATVKALPLSNGEVWSVTRDKVEAVKKAATERGLVVTEVGADLHHVFGSAPADMKLSEWQQAIIDRSSAAASTTGIKLVSGPSPEVLEHALTRDVKDGLPKITMTLGDNTVLTANRTSIDIRPDRAVWRGTVEGTGALVTLMWWPSGRMAGTVRHDGHIHAIRHMGGQNSGLYAIVDMAEERMPSEHAAITEHPGQHTDASVVRPPASESKRQRLLALAARPAPMKAKTESAAKGGSPSKDIVIDVIVAYTKSAASHYTDIQHELVDLAIEEANESFRMSNLGNIKLRLAHAYQTDYVEKGTHFDHVWRFADKGDGYMDEIHGLRDKYHADVAVLIVDDANGCGLSTRVFADEDEAFSVVHHACAATTYSLAHEIGHLIGARHDRNVDATPTPFAYGHGYVNGTKWRDIMSYKESCDGCSRLPVWSGPNVMVNGEPAGSVDLDNARVIREHAARVAGFR